MNKVTKKPIRKLGYDFIDDAYIPRGKDEYYLRNRQNELLFGKEKCYRHLTAGEIETLVQNNNTSDDWNKLLVTEAFDADLVKSCHFFGLVRIGKLEPYYLEFHNLRLPVGLYHSTICSCDFGDNVVIDNVNFLAHYIIANEAIIVNTNEISTSPHAKFGNGIIKEGEDEQVRIWLEICNENGGRKVLPFENMLPADAFLWSKYRDDSALMKKFRQFTEKKFDLHRGFYGVIGNRCIIKNCKIIKDARIGDDAYIKGANKLKNLTINSSPEATTQIGEGCELVNGIIGFGCRIFYGVKAVRFLIADHSNLKYGARLINSYLGSNATISCCEVLNSLIFPTHEQHHNNSFLCAALIMGQSNMAAGATIGSNHNSRGADGEIITGRGFWPGLCVSLKHNSRFATFALIAKGDFPYEINLPFPFALLINDVSKDKLLVMPGYWFLYNMYALSRNAWKYPHRDKRIHKIQNIEYDYLAPDSIEEMFEALRLMEYSTGKAAAPEQKLSEEEYIKKGRELLTQYPEKVAKLTIRLEGIENSRRPVELLKANRAYPVFKRMILFYAIREILTAFDNGTLKDFGHFCKTARKTGRTEWINAGGQLIPNKEVVQIKTDIKNQVLNSWEDIHDRYQKLGKAYPKAKLNHAIAALFDLKFSGKTDCTPNQFKGFIKEFEETAGWIQKQVEKSRMKDYKNPFRTMVYGNKKEMEKVIGKYTDDNFISLVKTQTEEYTALAEKIRKNLA